MSDPFVIPVLTDWYVLSVEVHWANRIDENKSASSKNQGSLPNVAYEPWRKIPLVMPPEDLTSERGLCPL